MTEIKIAEESMEEESVSEALHDMTKTCDGCGFINYTLDEDLKDCPVCNMSTWINGE